jgi:hypothetical protein
MLEVRIYDALGKETARFSEDDDTDVDFVSLLNSETHGPPALVAPNPRQPEPRASEGDRVLYINTAFVPIFYIERTSN